MAFRILGLDPTPYRPLFGLDDEALARNGALRMVVDEPDAAPCRIGVDDAAPGDTVLLLNFEHQPAATPFRASGPIFVREGAAAAFDAVDVIPRALARRLVSVRAYDGAGMMLDGEVVDGRHLAPLLDEWLARDEVAEVHLHYARRGCFAARAVRA